MITWRVVVKKAQAILKKSGIKDIVHDSRNLAWGLNWDHSLEYAKAVAETLEKAYKKGGKADVEKVLKEIEKVLNRGQKFRGLP